MRAAAREQRRGTRFATCPLMKSAFGPPTRLDLDRRLENTQNLVSTKVPEVIESLKASCNGIGMVMAMVATSVICGSFGVRDEFKRYTCVGARLFICAAP